MILAVDIGNTNITLGMYDNDSLTTTARLATNRANTKDQYALELCNIFMLNNIKPESVTGAIISSVVPEITGAVREAVEKVTGTAPLVLGPGIKTGLNIMTDDPGHLGADLVAAAVGAAAKYPLPCFIMDLGTATKIIVLDEQGRFRGCSISAGINISLDALASRTSQLPHICLAPPRSSIGTNTVDSMQSGTVFGTAAMLDGLSQRMEEDLGTPAATLVATGGLSREISRCCRRNVIYDENLLLDGLMVIYKKNV